MQSFKSFLKEEMTDTKDYEDLMYYWYLSEEEFADSTLNESIYDDRPEDSPKQKQKRAHLRKIRDNYRGQINSAYGEGKDSDLPITGSNRIDSVVDHIQQHYSLDKETQKNRIEEAKKRLAKAYGTTTNELIKKIYTQNEKLAKNKEKDVLDKNRRITEKTLGAAGSPSGYFHHHGGYESWVTTCDHQTAACAGPRGEREGTCLAMKGAYNFPDNVSKHELDSQIQHDSRETSDDHEHGAGHSPHKDWHLLATHYALEEAKKAKKKNRIVAVRTNVTDESKDALNTAIYKIKNGDIKTDDETKNVAQHHMALYNYGKNHNSSIHDPEHNVYTIASDTGPIVNKQGKLVKGNIPREKKLRNATTKQNTKHQERNTYVVVGGRSKTEIDEKGKGRLFVRPKSNDTQAQKDWHDRTLSGIRTVRRYDAHSTPHVEGHPENFHHPDGWGYTTVNQDGQKHRVHYQDYHVPVGASEHDARYDPKEKGNTKDRKGRRVGAAVVSTPTASTSAKNVEEGDMFHDVNDIKHHEADKHGRTGVLEVNHPNKMIAAGHKYEREKIEIGN